MAHEVLARMVYSYRKPMWHNLTVPSEVEHTAEEVLDLRFDGGHEIFLRTPTITLNGEAEALSDYYAIVRGPSVAEPNEEVLDFCTDMYHPLQPRDVAQSFDANVGEFAETMAFLSSGREMFISWEMPTIEVMAGDPVTMYGIIRIGFDTSKGANLFTSIYRPVCANTINMAQGWADKNKGAGKGAIWKGKGTNTNLLEHLGYWMEHVQGNAKAEADTLNQFFGQLVKTPISSEVEAREILFEAFPPIQDTSGLFPTQLKDAKFKRVEAQNKAQEKIRDGIFSLFDGAGTAITPDGWGMFNAGTEYFNHYQPSKRPIAESVMFGGRQQNSMKLVSVLANRS